MTIDYDFLTVDKRVLESQVWKGLQEQGAMIELRKGDHDDPVAGVARMKLADGSQADVVLARWKWELAVIERAERLDVSGAMVPVPRTGDLILLKLAAGGPIDQQDIISLLATDRDQLIREVEEHISEVRPDVTALWERIKSDTA